MSKVKAICSFSSCGRYVHARGLCPGHYYQHVSGQELRPLRYRRPNGSPPEIRWVPQPCPNPDLVGPCHVFQGCIGNGYGRVGIKGAATTDVHRYVWEQVHGPIPPKMEIDHQCRVRACCNVDHLRMVTHKTNSTENSVSIPAQNAAKTHCPKRHPYNAVNTHYAKTSRGGVSRSCKICRANRLRVFRSKKQDRPPE